MSHRDSDRSAGRQREATRPSWPDGSTYPYPLPFPLAQALDDDDDMWAVDDFMSLAESGLPSAGAGAAVAGGAAPEPRTPKPDRLDATAPQPAVPPSPSSYPWPPAPPPSWLRVAQRSGDSADSADGRQQGGRRWLLPAGLVAGAAGLGAVAVLMTGGHLRAAATGTPASPTMVPSTAAVQASNSAGAPRSTPSGAVPSASSTTGQLTLTQAQAAVARYTTVNNEANAQRSEALLATVESGPSLAIDSGLYQQQQAAGTAPYPAFSPVQATYYIPRGEPADGSRWFVVQVANAFQSKSATVTSEEYLLFTQSAPGAAWQNTAEPYLLANTSAPQIAVGADGLATAASLDATTFAVAPAQLPAATAASLDGTTGAGQAAVADPGNLADRVDERNWQAKVSNAAITDTHAASPGGDEFALLTTSGGALVFYTDAAQLTITAAAGSAINLTVPGFYSSAQTLSRIGLAYLEQFAAYDPAAGNGAPRVVADYSGITGKD